MKINWKLRLKNKTTLIALLTAVVAFVYQVLSVFEIVPSISQNEIINLITLVVTMLATLGIVVDPTTEGLTDSDLAMSYNEPAAKAKHAKGE